MTFRVYSNVFIERVDHIRRVYLLLGHVINI